MDKSLSHSRSDNGMRVLARIAERTHALGLTFQLMEDDEFLGDRITLGGNTVANFGLASYLALGDDDRLAKGARDAIDHYGTSYSSSIAYTAVPLYGELTEGLAQMFDSHVVLAPTTTLAHMAAMPALISPGDHVIVDSMAHASVRAATQALQAGGTKVELVEHSDLAALEERLIEIGDAVPVWFLTDGVFSMYGDVCFAVGINDLMDRYENLSVYCDDAHGFGWTGEHGRGIYLDRAGWHERLVVVAGLSKSFGATGGVIATTDEKRARAINFTGGPLVFGGPIPPAALGAGIASAEIHLSDELATRQAELMRRIDFVNQFSDELGLSLTASDRTPLWYLDVGDGHKMTDLLIEMKQAGFFLNAAGFPVVPLGHAGVRFTITLYNSLSQIEDMMTCLREKQLEVLGDTEIEIDIDQVAASKEPSPFSRPFVPES